MNITLRALVGFFLHPWNNIFLYSKDWCIVPDNHDEYWTALCMNFGAELPELSNWSFLRIYLSPIYTHLKEPTTTKKNVSVLSQDKKWCFWYSRESSGLEVAKPGLWFRIHQACCVMFFILWSLGVNEYLVEYLIWKTSWIMPPTGLPNSSLFNPPPTLSAGTF